MSTNSLFTVLGIGSHPDDLEISCGGTLAKYVEHGHRVVMVCMTDGRHGRSCPPDEMAEIRRQEAEASAALLGAELEMMGYEDLGLEDNLETRAKVVDVIRKFSPGVIITHAPFDLNPDHRITSKLVLDALIPAITPTFETAHQACVEMPVLYYMSTVCGTDFNPEEYVDITGSLKPKLEALSKHVSQLEVYLEYENRDLLKFVEAAAVVNGFRCGIGYAEGFRRPHIWTQNPVGRLLP